LEHDFLGGEATERVSFAIAAAAFITTLAFLVCEVYSLDVWWQIAIGRDIVATGSIPEIDRYSALGQGRSYHDSHWLFKVGLGVVAVWVAILSLTFWSCRSWIGVGGASALTFLVAMASMERFLPRPEIATFLGIALFYRVLSNRAPLRSRAIAILVAYQIVWANSHGLFVIGPFLAGCFWFAGVIRDRGRWTIEHRRSLTALSLVLAATLVTPFGIRGWQYAAVLFSEAGSGGPAVMRNLGELGDTFGPEARTAPAFWFFAVLLVLTGAGLAGAAVRRAGSPRVLVVIGLLAAALTGRRNVVLFALVSAPFVAEAWCTFANGRFRVPRFLSWGAAGLILAWAAFPVSGVYYLYMEIPARFGVGPTPSFFPHPLPSFLERIGFKGQVLNSNTLGGFYLYHRYPDGVPLTDGRWEVYDPDELMEVLGASRNPQRWKQLVARMGISGVLLAHTSPEAGAMLPGLAMDDEWDLFYLDQAASFWLPSAWADRVNPVPYQDPALLPSIDRVDDGLILNAFYGAVGAPQARIANLERTLGRTPRRADLLEQLGALQVAQGRFEDAEKTLEQLIRVDGSNPAAFNELAFLAYRRGDLQQAIRWMERALEVDPENPEFRENHERLRLALDAR
jgi:hypothetical protein